MRQAWRRVGAGFALVVALAWGPGGAAAPPPAGPAPERVIVVFVPDGDTAHVLWRGRRDSVRLLRVNAPERGRSGYAPARAFLRELLASAPVDLEFENPGVPERDRYGRLLGYLVAGGRNCSVEIVGAGWSRFWTRYGPGRYAKELAGAEAAARDAGRGIWSRRGRPSR